MCAFSPSIKTNPPLPPPTPINRGHSEIADMLRQHEVALEVEATRAAEEAAAEALRLAANPKGMLGEMRRPLKAGHHTN